MLRNVGLARTGSGFWAGPTRPFRVRLADRFGGTVRLAILSKRGKMISVPNGHISSLSQEFVVICWSFGELGCWSLHKLCLSLDLRGRLRGLVAWGMNCECNVFCFKFEERLFSRGISQMSAENLKQRSFAKPSKRCDYSLVFDEE